ncbi:MAG: c(7)-type cytochrome triheme domain-containing protein [Nitrospirota bacterium]
MRLIMQKNYHLFHPVNSLVITLFGNAIIGWGPLRLLPACLGEGNHNVQALVRGTGKARLRGITILHAVIALLVVLAVLVSAGTANAWNRAKPSEYGRVIIRNYSRGAGLAPVVFDHWVHRSRFTCRFCHVDIGFAMNAGETHITAAMNRQGLYCGACHDGKKSYGDKKIFAACSEGVSKEESSRCDRCHSQGKKVKKENDFTAFIEKLPKTALGNGIDWELAEEKGLIKPADFLAGVSVQRPSMKVQKDFSIEVRASWVDKVLFSHRKHAVWNGCEVCHPEIFPNVKKGSTKYSMFEIVNGQYCGVCHDKVAFPLQDCQRCHTQPVEMESGTSR